ncbi:MAG TPA: VOC family protein [Acidimicrobiales bacterium]|nr:VOC family protein [Acidimicrobiales bacterium]
MAFQHVAFATKDLSATHDFYTELMGFRLVKVVVGPTESDGWAKHAFYDTGGEGMIAFWELHDDSIEDGWRTELSTGLGLPLWVNHVAFTAGSVDELAQRRRLWQEHGITVVEIDHGFCTSIYATDPNGVMVEFCCQTREFTEEEQAAARRLLGDPSPEIEPAPRVTIHRRAEPATATAAAGT